MKKTVIAFGEVLWDIMPTATVLGGAPLNFTYRINSLGNTGLMVSRLGRDELGEKAFRQIEALGMPLNFIQWDESIPTGTVEVSFDAQRNPDYTIIPEVAYDHIELTDDLLKQAETADCICFGTLAQRADKSKKTLRRLLEQSGRAIKFLDINLRKKCYSPESIIYSLERSDILKLNSDEVNLLMNLLGYPAITLPDFCEKMIATWDLKFCIVTMAGEGAFVQSAQGDAVYAPGFEIILVDSLGSGDAFSAGFIHQILQGAPLKEAVVFGNKLGAKVATQKGATVPIEISELAIFDQGTHNRIIKQELKEYIL